MKVLWLCNVMLPLIAEDLSKPPTNFGGWLSGLSNELLKTAAVQLTVCFPITFQKSLLEGEVENLKYFGFPNIKNDQSNYSKEENYFVEIVKNTNPDIIHIFGTEIIHTLIMIKTCERLGKLDKVVINIQGLVSVIANHYMANLPMRVQRRFTFRDFLKQDNIIQQKKMFINRGISEVEAIQKTKHVIGRTTWDKACTFQINPKVQYHFCNETLRDIFYKYEWSLEKCERYSIFISQATLPIKGLHFMLAAMPLILKQFPDAKLYIAGNDIIKSDTIWDRLKRTSYGKYIKELIKRNHLENCVKFTGLLDEKQICERYLQSHVFVCPSSIENSPNSLGEAMILGVPCIAANVGGVADMLIHKEEGFVYQTDAPYMLAYYVCAIFGDEELTISFSKKAKEHALKTHDKKENTRRMIEIYNDIMHIEF